MTRNIRKIVSIICAVALLLSLCAVSFIGSSSAAVGKDDGATITNVWQTESTVLDLTFEGANNGGIAMSTNSGKTIADGAFELMNRSNTYGASWLGKDATVKAGETIPSITNLTTSTTLKDNLFEMQSSTTYKVTIKYAFRKDVTTGIAIQYMAAKDPYLSSGHDRGTFLTSVITKTYDANDAKSGTQVAGDTSYGDWNEDTYIFTTKADLANKYLGIRIAPTSDANGNYLKIDSIKIETGSMVENIEFDDLDNEYVFDYTNATTQATVIARQNALAGNSNTALQHYSWYDWNGWLAGVGNKGADWATVESYPGKPGFTAEGMKYTIGKGANITDTSTNAWVANALIYDTAVGNSDGYGNAGGYLKLKDEASYIITVKYKVTQVTGTYLRLFVGGLSTPTKGALDVIPGSLVEHKQASDEWQYLTFSLDTSVNTSFADKIITLGACTNSDKKWNEVIVESITVKEKRDTQNGVAFVETYNEGKKTIDFAAPGAVYDLDVPDDTEEKGFAGWYTSSDFDAATKVDINNYVPAEGVNKLYAKWSNKFCVVTFNENGVERQQKLAVGEALDRGKRPDSRLFFEGWYYEPDYKTQVTTVPEIGAVTLYAKYTGIYLQFNNKGYVDTTGTPEIVTDPTDEDNTVLKFSAGNNLRPNFSLPAFDGVDAGAFRLETNTKYYYSFRLKVAAGSNSSGIDFYYGDDPKATGNRTSFFSAGSASENLTEEDTDWTTYEGTFSTGDTFYLERVYWAYQNKLYFTLYPGNGDTNKNGEIDEDETARQITVYVDDFIIYKELTEAPEGTSTIHFETNGDEMSNLYGFAGETIVLPTPKLGGYKFVGWYTDKKLTKGISQSYTFTNEDITLYAKWESSEFVVDFSDYQKGNAAARAKFLKDDNGNDYVDWWVEHAEDNKTDVSSPYRIFLNKGGAHYTVVAGVEYTISFKYKLLDAEVDTVVAAAVTSAKLNGWTKYMVQDTKITLSNVDEKNWQTATFSFIANPDPSEGANYLALGIANHGHVLIDDISVTSSSNTANLYGSTIISFNTAGGLGIDPISGEPDEAITDLPAKAYRTGYVFNGWYTDADCTTPFTAKTFGEEDLVLYAGWLLGQFEESYEDFPSSVVGLGVAGAYKLYNETNFADYDKANVQSGSVSMYRDGSQTGNKAFTICRSTELKLVPGRDYTLTFYVKPEAIVDAAGTISLVGMSSYTGINSPTSTNIIKTVGELEAGKWQKVTYNFTADSEYVGIATTAGNNMYLDNFVITDEAYVAPPTGDTTVSAFVLTLMVLLAAGALVVTGKKVFEK